MLIVQWFSCLTLRWILLCFKREFPEAEALRIWEACWAHYQTDYFHLFVCVAIISVYGEDVIQQNLPADEMLLHFSSLAMHMSADVVLKKVCIISIQYILVHLYVSLNILNMIQWRNTLKIFTFYFQYFVMGLIVFLFIVVRGDSQSCDRRGKRH